ncbi:MAG TPA: hypothetical protein VIS05_10820 [Ilumatobacter sp.]
MITLCWAAKGGSGTTVVAAALALSATEPTLLVDLDGDQPAVLGSAPPDGPGVRDWVRSDAGPSRIAALEVDVAPHVRLLPAGRPGPGEPGRWSELARWLQRQQRPVVIDAGGHPPAEVFEAADRRWLVTRACYLALRAAVAQPLRPTGVVLVDEPGRALDRADVEACLGAPVVATTLCDPAIARAVDAGLLAARLPSGLRRVLRAAAA